MYFHTNENNIIDIIKEYGLSHTEMAQYIARKSCLVKILLLICTTSNLKIIIMKGIYCIFTLSMMLVFFACNNSAEDYLQEKEQITVDDLKLKLSEDHDIDPDGQCGCGCKKRNMQCCEFCKWDKALQTIKKRCYCMDVLFNPDDLKPKPVPPDIEDEDPTFAILIYSDYISVSSNHSSQTMSYPGAFLRKRGEDLFVLYKGNGDMLYYFYSYQTTIWLCIENDNRIVKLPFEDFDNYYIPDELDYNQNVDQYGYLRDAIYVFYHDGCIDVPVFGTGDIRIFDEHLLRINCDGTISIFNMDNQEVECYPDHYCIIKILEHGTIVLKERYEIPSWLPCGNN